METYSKDFEIFAELYIPKNKSDVIMLKQRTLYVNKLILELSAVKQWYKDHQCRS